jgi:hypothetical protein
MATKGLPLDYSLLGFVKDAVSPRWSSGSVLATGPKVHGFKPGRGQ